MYQVKFEYNGEVIYGIVDSYSKKARAAEKDGYAIVHDIQAREWHVERDLLTEIPFGFSREQNEYERYIEARYNEARNISNALPDDGQLRPGAMFRIGVADGYAYYVVTSVMEPLCYVEWRGFQSDRYYDHHFGAGGQFMTEDVIRYVNSERRLRAIFGDDQ